MKMWLILFTAFSLTAGSLYAVDPEKVVSQMFILGNDPYMKIRAQMVIHLKNGIKERTLDVYVKREGGSSGVLMHIIAPGFLNNMKFLAHRNEKGVESKWLKTSKGVRRLSSANNSEQVFDSDFTVEDLSEVRKSDFTLAYVETRLFEDEEVYVIEAIPLYRGSLYSRKVLKIGVHSRILREVDFFNDRQELFKQYRLLSTQLIEKRVYPHTCVMENIENGTKTTLDLENIVTGEKLPDKLFNKGNL